MTREKCLLDGSSFGELSAARGLEWMVANGRGGYAMASVSQLLTRRYHGLLVAAIKPPLERFVLLAKLEATITINGLTYEIGTNDYAEAVHPQGHKLLESFTTEPHPTWRWRAGQALVEQTLCMAEGEDTTYVRYRLAEGDEAVQIIVRPMCTSRHFHSLTHYHEMGPPTVEESGSKLKFQWGGPRPGWQISHNGSFKSRTDWYYNFILAAEADRGYDCSQDLFVPGIISMTLEPGDPVGLVFAASTQDRSWTGWESAFSESAARRDLLTDDAALADPLAAPLMHSGADFVVTREDASKTVIAGYPWFGDWGRDTFIALPGLCLVPGRYADARAIIDSFSRFVDSGMIPNRFPDFNETPAYNAADASLWYIHAIDRYLTYSGDWSFIQDRMFSVIVAILDGYERGTRHGIRACDDALLTAGEPGLALTWMDAQVNGWSVTPRIGKPVEVNALWYNALEIGTAMARRMGNVRRTAHWADLAARAKASFNARFWNDGSGCLYDVADPDGRAGDVDAAIRANQLLAISLTHPVLDKSGWRQVVAVCERQLWTPMGLRTLSPLDSRYRGHYNGHMPQRDEAYHQGTAWPWLLGPFVTAYVRAMGDTPQTRQAARGFLSGLSKHMLEAGIGSVSEVADGDAPHAPGGCPWQAWSVAEPLRALCEDVLRTHPKRLPRPSTAAPEPARPVKL